MLRRLTIALGAILFPAVLFAGWLLLMLWMTV